MPSSSKKYFFQQIILFNKTTYLASLLFLLSLLLLLIFVSLPFLLFYFLLIALIGGIYFSFASILFSYFIYDLSDLYHFNWLCQLLTDPKSTIFNVFSGYTEAGHLLQKNLNNHPLQHYDFFNKNTSVTSSIKRAKELSEPINCTEINYNNWQLNNKADYILFMQSLHELREADQQTECLIEASKYLNSPDSRIVIVEHLRDIKNFSIYSMGVFHFHSYHRWISVINASGLAIEKEFTITPFVKVFVLKRNQ